MQIYWGVLVFHHPTNSHQYYLHAAQAVHTSQGLCQSTARTRLQLQGHTGVGEKGRHLNPVGCHCGDRLHLAINIATMSPSELNGKTNNCMENVSVKDVGISGFSFEILEIWKSEICTTELCFSLHEKKNISQEGSQLSKLYIHHIC